MHHGNDPHERSIASLPAEAQVDNLWIIAVVNSDERSDPFQNRVEKYRREVEVPRDAKGLKLSILDGKAGGKNQRNDSRGALSWLRPVQLPRFRPLKVALPYLTNYRPYTVSINHWWATLPLSSTLLVEM